MARTNVTDDTVILTWTYSNFIKVRLHHQYTWYVHYSIMVQATSCFISRHHYSPSPRKRSHFPAGTKYKTFVLIQNRKILWIIALPLSYSFEVILLPVACVNCLSCLSRYLAFTFIDNPFIHSSFPLYYQKGTSLHISSTSTIDYNKHANHGIHSCTSCIYRR